MENKNNKEITGLLVKWYRLLRLKEFNETADKRQAWDAIQMRIQKKKRRIVYFRYAAAALWIGVLLAGWFTWSRLSDLDREETLSKTGKSKAILFVGNGMSYDLEAFNGTIDYHSITLACNDQEELVYQKQKSDSVYQHTIEVPRGGEYRVRLADNSQVHLNSVSRFSFPTGFSESMHLREVLLSYGEAYFEVEKDATKPFVVKTPTGEIRVLGTKFNVLVSDHTTCVTLVEGSVRVDYNNSTKILVPGEQATVELGNITTRNVDLNQELGWIRGVFEYNNTPLNEIVAQLSLWYDVDFRFASEELKSTRFAGVILRNQSLEEAIEILEKVSQVHFKVKNNYILITK